MILADGKDYNIRPLTFRQLRELDEAIKKLDDREARKGTGYLDLVSKIVGTSLQREYPEVNVEDLLDMTLAPEALYAALGVSRPRGNVVAIEKAGSAGEAAGQASSGAASAAG